jgi:hypothetical protein
VSNTSLSAKTTRRTPAAISIAFNIMANIRVPAVTSAEPLNIPG